MHTDSDPRLLYFSPAWSGGLADYAHEQAQALAQIGVQVTLLTSPAYSKADSSLYEQRRTLKTAGAFKSPIALLRKSVFATHLLQNYATLAKTIQREGFQYVLLGSYAEYLAPLWVWPLCRLADQGVRFGAVVHDPVRGYVVGPLWWHRWSIACAYSFLQEAFVHEAIELDTVKPMPNLRTTVIPQGVYNFPPAQMSRESVRANLKIPSHVKVLLSFGHIRDGKNLDLALRAMANFPEVYLVVAGKQASSAQRPVSYYQNLAYTLGVADRCRWQLDFIPEDQVGDLFNACDGILLTYSASFQSASSVLNVGAAYRRPCIASGGQGNLQTMVRRYGLGVWVEPDSWEAIGAGIQQWLKGIDPPRWEDYERDNSWARNAELVYARFWGNTCN